VISFVRGRSRDVGRGGTRVVVPARRADYAGMVQKLRR
jgi:hypothetical protein